MAFTKETFQLLEKLHQDPQYAVYKREEKEFKRWLEKPFEKLLLHDVNRQLPEEIRKAMILEYRVFGRIMKNDHGKAGACDYFWGAFYPNFLSSKTDDVQLLTFINHKYIEFGFFFGWHCPLERKEEYLRHLRRLCNSPSDYERAIEFISEALPEESVRFREDDYEIQNEVVTDNEFSWRGYFEVVKDESADRIPLYSPMVVYPSETVLRMTTQELAKEIAATFTAIFPLVILAISNDPIPTLREYIEARK